MRIVISIRVLFTGVGVGVIFAILDGLLNANPLTQRVYAVYRPIAWQSANAPLGLSFDILSGIVMAVLFVALRPALSGGPAAKGLAFGLMVWFFQIAMGVAAQAVMFNVPGSVLAYTLLSGLVEMTILGTLAGYCSALLDDESRGSRSPFEGRGKGARPPVSPLESCAGRREAAGEA